MHRMQYRLHRVQPYDEMLRFLHCSQEVAPGRYRANGQVPVSVCVCHVICIEPSLQLPASVTGGDLMVVNFMQGLNL